MWKSLCGSSAPFVLQMLGRGAWESAFNRHSRWFLDTLEFWHTWTTLFQPNPFSSELLSHRYVHRNWKNKVLVSWCFALAMVPAASCSWSRCPDSGQLCLWAVRRRVWDSLRKESLAARHLNVAVRICLGAESLQQTPVSALQLWLCGVWLASLSPALLTGLLHSDEVICLGELKPRFHLLFHKRRLRSGSPQIIFVRLLSEAHTGLIAAACVLIFWRSENSF